MEEQRLKIINNKEVLIMIIKRLNELRNNGLISDSVLRSFLNEHDPIIKIDNSIKSDYSELLKKQGNSEWKRVGSDEFDVSCLELWLHPDQKRGIVTGDVIYKYLKVKGLLKKCLDIIDLQAIQRRGVGFFGKYFSGKMIFGYGTVISYHSCSLCVPYLHEVGNCLFLGLHRIGANRNPNSPALRIVD